MKTSDTLLIASVLALMFFIVGCGGEVEVPETPSATKISDVLAKQVDMTEKACDSGELTGEYLSAISMSVAFLKGHLGSEGNASTEQLADLDRVHRQLTQLQREGRRNTDDEWGKPNPESVKAILVDIRSILVSLPE